MSNEKEIPIPPRLALRPRHQGMIVPYFCAWYINGHQCTENTEGAVPSFPTTDQRKLVLCVNGNLCWLCGKQLGAYKAFVIGPAGAIAEASYEPPSHRDCARYAMQVCPHLNNPDHTFALDKGFKLRPHERVIHNVSAHNPGVNVIWVTKHYGVEIRDQETSTCIFTLGKAEYCELFTRGRRATYKEAADAIQLAIQRNGMLDHGDKRELAWRVQQLLNHVGSDAGAA